MGFDIGSGGFLFDDYVIPDEVSVYRRPTFDELNGPPTSSNPFVLTAHEKANMLKATALICPHVSVDAVWLFNNPHLYYLSSLPAHPNDIHRLLQTDFLRPYWGSRRIGSFQDLMDHTFPSTGPGEKDYSWLKDQFANRSRFDRSIRPKLQSYVVALDELTFHELNGDPRREMIVRLEEAIRELTVEGATPNPIATLLRKIDTDLKAKYDNVFRFPVANDHIEKMTGEDKRTQWRWFVYEHIYLPAHSTVSGFGPVGFRNAPVALGQDKLDLTDLARRELQKSIDPQEVRHLMELVAALPVDAVVDIRRSQAFLDYTNQLRRLENVNAAQRIEILGQSVLQMMASIAPELDHATGNTGVFLGLGSPGLWWHKNQNAFWLGLNTVMGLIQLPIAIPLKFLWDHRPQSLKEYYTKVRGRKVLANVLRAQGITA